MTDTPTNTPETDADIWAEVAEVKLNGARFHEHSIPLDALGELERFGKIVCEIARHLYLRDNPSRQRLSPKITRTFDLRMTQVREGSAIAAINAPVMERQGDLMPGDPYLVRALRHSLDVINYVNDNTTDAGMSFPSLPPEAVEQFSMWGRSLQDDESIALLPVGGGEAKFTHASRERFVEMASKTYWEDFEVVADVWDVLRTTQAFCAVTVNGERLYAPIEPAFESTITKALHESDEYCIRLSGRAVISKLTGEIKKVDRVYDVNLCPRSYLNFDEEEPSIDELFGLALSKTNVKVSDLPSGSFASDYQKIVFGVRNG